MSNPDDLQDQLFALASYKNRIERLARERDEAIAERDALRANLETLMGTWDRLARARGDDAYATGVKGTLQSCRSDLAELVASPLPPPAATKERTGRRWTEVLCQQCGGNGVIKITGGVSTCPRCEGRCYEPDVASPADERTPPHEG